jgi:phage-related protein
MAQYKVDTTEKIRNMMGVAKYNDYVKSVVDKYGQEKADEIIAEPVEQLKDIEAYQVLHRVANNTNPKGVPKSAMDLKTWTYADQVRLEMGEQEWWDSVKIIGYEFGLEKADALFGLSKEKELIESAQDRLVPGMKEKRAEFLAGLQKIEASVKAAAPGAKSPADYASAFKDLYPTKEDLEAALK